MINSLYSKTLQIFSYLDTVSPIIKVGIIGFGIVPIALKCLKNLRKENNFSKLSSKVAFIENASDFKIFNKVTTQNEVSEISKNSKESEVIDLYEINTKKIPEILKPSPSNKIEPRPPGINFKYVSWVTPSELVPPEEYSSEVHGNFSKFQGLGTYGANGCVVL